MRRRMVLVAFEPVHSLVGRKVGLGRHAGGQHQWLWPQRHFCTLCVDHDGPFLRRLVKARQFAGGAGPAVQLHHSGIHFKPVADLVLGCKDRPVFRKFHAGQMIVPDRVMRTQRLVVVSPTVSGFLVFFQDDRRNARLPQPGTQCNAALTAADDHDIGLLRVAQIARLCLARFLPDGAMLVRAVLRSCGPIGAGAVFVALQLELVNFFQREGAEISHLDHDRSPQPTQIKLEPGPRPSGSAVPDGQKMRINPVTAR